jgi:hypothetical protein
VDAVRRSHCRLGSLRWHSLNDVVAFLFVYDVIIRLVAYLTVTRKDLTSDDAESLSPSSAH